MKEQPYLKRITDMATRFGWKWWHVPAPMRWTSKGWIPAREAAGLPDLVLMHEDPWLMILAEIKGDGGKLSVEQTEFLRIASRVAQFVPADTSSEPPLRVLSVYVWTPDDEPIVERILRSKVLL